MPNVSLTPELGAFAAACVASGRYANVSEVHRAALRLLRVPSSAPPTGSAPIRSPAPRGQPRGSPLPVPDSAGLPLGGNLHRRPHAASHRTDAAHGRRSTGPAGQHGTVSRTGHLVTEPTDQELKDPRQHGKADYPLAEILLLCLFAVLAGVETIADIALSGERKLALLRRFRPFAKGTPTHDHRGDILAVLYHEQRAAIRIATLSSRISTGMCETHWLTASR
jgi:hypothetical protein